MDVLFYHESRCNYTPALINSFVDEDWATQVNHLLPLWFVLFSVCKVLLENIYNFSPPPKKNYNFKYLYDEHICEYMSLFSIKNDK